MSGYNKEGGPLSPSLQSWISMTEALSTSPALPSSHRHLHSLVTGRISDILLRQESHHVKSFWFWFSHKLLKVFLQINWTWINFLNILSPGNSSGSVPSQLSQQSPTKAPCQWSAKVCSLAEDSYLRFSKQGEAAGAVLLLGQQWCPSL